MATLSSTGRFAAGEACADNDILYGPYATVAAAHAALLNAEQNVNGRTVGIQTGNTIEEYWYQGGTTEQHLVKKQTASVEVDSELSSTSEKPVQNKVVKSALDAKGTYSKPSGGIPKTDLASGVQTSLDKADTAVQSSEKGVVNGVATLGSDGKVPQSQLPSYVDDVLEYSNQSSFPATGESGKIYIALDTNKTYRWSGSVYVEISQSLALGETSSTAFAGDRGKAIEDKIPSNASSSNKLATASDLSGKVDKVSGATPNNFASFDANGGIKNSGCNEDSFATAAQGVLAETAVQQVTVGTTTTGAAGTNASVTNSGTSTAPVLDFTIPRGADAYNPFKGTYLITDTLPTTGQAGDYIYVVDSQTPQVTHLYAWNGTTFSDTSETVTIGDSQFANSTKPISQTNVVNDLTTGGTTDVASAETVKTLNTNHYEKLIDTQKSSGTTGEGGGGAYIPFINTTTTVPAGDYILKLTVANDLAQVYISINSNSSNSSELTNLFNNTPLKAGVYWFDLVFGGTEKYIKIDSSKTANSSPAGVSFNLYTTVFAGIDAKIDAETTRATSAENGISADLATFHNDYKGSFDNLFMGTVPVKSSEYDNIFNYYNYELIPFLYTKTPNGTHIQTVNYRQYATIKIPVSIQQGDIYEIHLWGLSDLLTSYGFDSGNNANISVVMSSQNIPDIVDNTDFKAMATGSSYVPPFGELCCKGTADKSYAYIYFSFNVGTSEVAVQNLTDYELLNRFDTLARYLKVCKRDEDTFTTSYKPYRQFDASQLGMVPVAQGSQNAGKYLGVGGDGNVTLFNGAGEHDIANAVYKEPSRTLYLSSELTLGTPTLGDGWSGDVTNGFSHETSTDDSVLELPVTVTSNKLYAVSFNLNTASVEDSLWFKLGDNPYFDAYNGLTNVVIGFVGNGDNLYIKCKKSKAVTITNLKVREVKNSESYEEILQLPLYGIVTTGDMVNNVSGFWDIALSGNNNALPKTASCTRSIAIGYASQRNIISGNRNVCVGTFSMPYITEGENNVAIGADTIYGGSPAVGVNVKAYDNIAIGKGTLSHGTTDGDTISRNVAIGKSAMSNNNANAQNNVCVGYAAGGKAKENNVYIGYSAGLNASNDHNTEIGYMAGALTGGLSTTQNGGNHNTFIGSSSGVSSSPSNDNIQYSIALGANAKVTKSNQIMIGTTTQTEIVVLGNKKLVFNSDGTVTWTQI